MNEHLPYEEQIKERLKDLPLPDETMAWEDMKRRLEEDDDDRGVIWWKRGCGIWGLLLLALFAAGWWIFKPQGWFYKPTSSKTEQIVTGNQTALESRVDTAHQKETQGQDQNEAGNTDRLDNLKQEDSLSTSHSGQAEKINETVKKTNTTKQIRIEVSHPTSKKKNVSQTRTKKDATSNSKRNGNISVSNDVNTGINSSDAKVNQTQNEFNKGMENRIHDSAVSVTNNVAMTDTNSKTINNLADSSVKINTVKADSTEKTDQKTNSKKEKETKPLYFSAGISVQQLIPVSGQKATPYNALGRKGTMLDYIPSVYGRLNKTGRWFIQAEFKYGAPQLSKSLLYNQESTLDTVGPRNHTITISRQVLKTYYHQLPVSFNYYVAPNLSIGAGVSWNKFHGAVTQEDRTSRDITTQVVDSFSSKIVRVKNDTSGVFSTNYFQAIFETQYQWKRFSLGARYAFGLQPYIRFTLPGNISREEKNTSLQVFLRYELWRSKKD